MELNYPIPQDSANAFEQFLKPDSSAKANAGLIFDRFAPDTQEETSSGGRDDPPKKKGLDQVRKIAERADVSLLEAWNKRWRESVKKDGANQPDNPFSMSTDWRFITGLGRKGPFEVGFTFNRYGFPYLPGSSVKGIARAKAFFDIAEKIIDNGNIEDKLNPLFQAVREKLPEKAREKLTPLTALDLTLSQDTTDKEFEEEFKTCCAPSNDCWDLAKKFRKIFGNTGGAGSAVFFDAIPDKAPELDLDIINPHYPDYYKEGSSTPPTDWQSPIPTYFLTVHPNTTFWFAVGWRGELNDVNRELQKDAKNWLKAGLEKLGAGAKTSAGYGYFK